MDKATILVDLTYGDGSKGANEHYLIQSHDAVVKYCGGPQAAHRVVLEDGRAITLQHFSAAVLDHKPTYLSKHCVISLGVLEQQAQALYHLGYRAIYQHLFIDPEAIVVTPYHQHEAMLDKKNLATGSCGTGQGVAQRFSIYEDYTIRIKDLKESRTVLEKLQAQEILFGAIPRYKPVDIARRMLDGQANFSLGTGFIPDLYDRVLFTGAAGVLIDRESGFKPHVTQTDVVPIHAYEMIPEGVPTELVGCLRSYMVRHGPGPFPTETVGHPIVQEADNHDDPIQGDFRQGWLDTHLLKYAISQVHQRTNNPVDYLMVSHLDCVTNKWKIAGHHRYGDRPEYRDVHGPNELARLVHSATGINVKYGGFGPTRKDRREL